LNVWIVSASVNELRNIRYFYPTLRHEECKLAVVDEGDQRLRAKNVALLGDLEYDFYGPKERAAWFKARFPSKAEYPTVIPERCHAETSFGFLVAFEQGAEIIIELDDDVFPYKDYSIVDGHIQNLRDSSAPAVSSSSKWYNTLLNLVLDKEVNLYPRGHPYSPDVRSGSYNTLSKSGEPVINMGLWTGDPDLDAITILQTGGLNGKSTIRSVQARNSKVLVDKGTYFAVCSMNTALKRKIIPAFYQLYMKLFGIDRFDDIWSGILIKKIADHLGDAACLGAPLIFHDKRPRGVFKDLHAELEGIIINETFWRIIDNIQLDGSDYHECYESLIDGLSSQVRNNFPEKLHRDFLKMQVKKMRLWLEIVGRID
jgi:hypothetical protein